MAYRKYTLTITCRQESWPTTRTERPRRDHEGRDVRGIWNAERRCGGWVDLLTTQRDGAGAASPARLPRDSFDVASAGAQVGGGVQRRLSGPPRLWCEPKACGW